MASDDAAPMAPPVRPTHSYRLPPAAQSIMDELLTTPGHIIASAHITLVDRIADVRRDLFGPDDDVDLTTLLDRVASPPRPGTVHLLFESPSHPASTASASATVS